MPSLRAQCDLHIHTFHSECARSEMRVPAIIDACLQAGLRYAGLTDHIYEFTDRGVLRETRNEVSRDRSALKVLVGCEVDVLDIGRHSFTPDMAESLDYVMVSANHFHLPWVAQPKDLSPESVALHFLAMFRYACSLPFADTIAHPFVVFRGTFDPRFLELLRDDDLMEAIRLAKENHIAVEISPRALMHDQLDFRFRFYGLCREAGLRFSIGSDAHSLENVGRTQVLAPMIEQLGLTDHDIWLPKGALEY